MSIYSMDFNVPGFLCDPNFELTLDSYQKIFMEASSRQSDELEELKSDQHRWIIYKWDIEILDKIFWKDNIKVVTFSRGVKGFYAFRNFQMYKDDKLVARADSVWLLIGLDGKIKKIPKNLLTAYGSSENGNMIETKRNNIKLLDKAENEYQIHVRLRDLDYNNHVNNTNYLIYVLDSYKDLKGYKADKIKMIYKEQVKYGEEVILSYKYEREENDMLLLIFEINSKEGNLKTYGNILWIKDTQTN